MSDFDRQVNAYNRLTVWMKEAQDLVGIFRATGLPVPPPLIAAMGESDHSASHTSPRLAIPNEEPSEYLPGWIWISRDDATPTTLALGMLRESDHPIPVSVLAERISKQRPSVNPRTVMNIGPRLDGETIERTSEGWRLIGNSPILTKSYAWGPVDLFTRPEVAAHRRMWILHLLEREGGLMATQIESKLRKLNIKPPVSKDLVKVDIDAMRNEHKICRSGGSKKWKITKRE